MCTVSWLHDDDGYQLLCNRDEKYSRAPALVPEVKIRDGVRYIAPTDANAGGTWIGVNEFGISLCLLNGPPAGARPAAPPRTSSKSRGLIPLELVTSQSLTEACMRASSLDLYAVAPFSLVVLEPGQHAAAIMWDGRQNSIISYAEPYMPFISSSFDAEGVQLKRREEFHRCLTSSGRLEPAVLFEFHASHGRRPDAYSPCMHRPDAETVSFSWVNVNGAGAEFFYTPGAPCRWRPGVTRRLALVQ